MSGQFLSYEFKHGLNKYLASRVPDPTYPRSQILRSLADIIAFNRANPDREMRYFGQEIFEQAQARGNLDDGTYRQALANNRRMGGRDGIDAVLAKYQLDALVAPTGQPVWPIDLLNGDHITTVSSTPAALAGYPIITIPGRVRGRSAGRYQFLWLALTANQTLIRLAYAFEQATQARRSPQFLEDLPAGFGLQLD